MSPRTPVVALVGRPNVGKSTLFNRLTRSRAALVADIPGLTRDRHYAPAMFDGVRVVLIDTGGFEPIDASGVAAQMARQTRQAIVEADLVVLVVDGRHGMAARDLEIANELRRAARTVRVAVNKTEGMNRAVAIAEFHRLGLGEPIAVSSAHGDGIGNLIDECLSGLGPLARARVEPADVDPDQAPDNDADLPPAGAAGGDGDSPTTEPEPEPEPEPETREIRVAVVGRPNSGKSTLINALLGEERLIAFDQPGTTRDSIEVPFRFADRAFTMIDTAGIRRRGKVTEVIEKFSVVKTLQSIEDCNVCILLVDAADGVSDQDASIAAFILESGRALVVGLNKWDKVPADERAWVEQEFGRKLHFLSFAQTHLLSALKGRGLKPLMQSVVDAHAAATAKLSTPKLTRLLQAAVQHQQPPRKGPHRPKLRYAHQGGRNPPIIVIHGNSLSNVPQAYRRYLEGWFRDQLSLRGTPLRIEFRSGRNPYADKEGK
ncbi:MAG: ribosome biogenesis GTPase Der [Lautropia sp.]